MEQFIETFLMDYGPFAVLFLLLLSGIGLALGEEIIIIPAGILVGIGKMDLATTAACTYIGVVVADVMWFAICYHYGTPLLHRRWFKRAVHPRRLLQAKHQLEQRGVWLVVMARFIPVTRTTTITIAGMLHMSSWKFVLATAGCAVITTPLQLGLGILIAKGIGSEDSTDTMLHVLGLAMLVVAIVVIAGWIRRARRAGHQPMRSKAVWLRRFRPPRIRDAKAPDCLTDEPKEKRSTPTAPTASSSST